MITAFALMSLYKTPTIPLSEVCERFFCLSYEEALKKAARNELPVPTFRLTASRKAPLMVSCEDLGAWIDKARSEASRLWEQSQV
ncbi:pyocin activator PrtN family protein [uncultured Azohydromonas sp.]|uniref:pyocin activator PrtN family protein n=1 Tax=uncultured Azohydromonas sp. TaxID=487342 RepID=UPI002637146D|nr:pyocin activator PrtN family protein [uncultured Azohydromonas sp.]